MYDLRDLVAIGRSGTVSHTVTPSDAATKYSPELKDLLSTPACIRLAIQASAEAIDKYLPEGYVSIGRYVEFEHTASTRVGMTVTVEATVVEVQPQYVVLEFKVSDGAGPIGFGKHRRSIVVMENLLNRSKKREATMLNDRPI